MYVSFFDSCSISVLCSTKRVHTASSLYISCTFRDIFVCLCTVGLFLRKTEKVLEIKLDDTDEEKIQNKNNFLVSTRRFIRNLGKNPGPPRPPRPPGPPGPPGPPDTHSIVQPQFEILQYFDSNTCSLCILAAVKTTDLTPIYFSFFLPRLTPSFVSSFHTY